MTANEIGITLWAALGVILLVYVIYANQLSARIETQYKDKTTK